MPLCRPSTQEVWDQVRARFDNSLTATDTPTTWNEACFLREFQQGKNIIDAAAQIAPRLEILALSSLSNAMSNSKHTWVWGFDSKAQSVKYLTSKAGEGADGTIIFRSIIPSDTDESSIKETYTESPTCHLPPCVNPPTATGPFVEALVLRAPPRTTMHGTSGPMQFNKYIKLWSQLQGVKTAVQALTSNEAVSLWPDGFGIELAKTACYIRESGWDGAKVPFLPEQAGVDLNALTDVASYIKSVDWSSVLNR
ncbi:uncharacterized protein A1O9_02124 [Exophiala aquamarina CBS 119918]|uniref:NmrA-like domain-containing protein n=1 Tax=Exophiala aquamarina CBS 119918 TaxID=1182545 RepID=A0A072PMI9_9EURO|nr:uncharacterized protein A1O9_02124 [Exophiala aquamarina CBS 119918]KEF60563.1 hypothetical protein A1O9_02124 [Exophiala aquamarina CBS 119918]